MPDLTPAPSLNGYSEKFGDILLEEKRAFALFSLVAPLGGKEKLAEKINQRYQLAWPKPGRLTKAKGRYFLAMNQEQIFALFIDGTDYSDFQKKIGSEGYSTDQSDNWCCLQISGPQSRSALERICPLDLHPNIFREDCVARTVMEHCGTIILRNGDDSFLLLSVHSSSHSFLHAISQSIRNIF